MKDFEDFEDFAVVAVERSWFADREWETRRTIIELLFTMDNSIGSKGKEPVDDCGTEVRGAK